MDATRYTFASATRYEFAGCISQVRCNIQILAPRIVAVKPPHVCSPGIFHGQVFDRHACLDRGRMSSRQASLHLGRILTRQPRMEAIWL